MSHPATRLGTRVFLLSDRKPSLRARLAAFVTATTNDECVRECADFQVDMLPVDAPNSPYAPSNGTPPAPQQTPQQPKKQPWFAEPEIPGPTLSLPPQVDNEESRE